LARRPDHAVEVVHRLPVQLWYNVVPGFVIIITIIIIITVVIPYTRTPTALTTPRRIHGNENNQQQLQTRTKYNHTQSQTTSGKSETGNEFTLDNILSPRTIFTNRLIRKTK
jgi:hypothetical protein